MVSLRFQKQFVRRSFLHQFFGIAFNEFFLSHLRGLYAATVVIRHIKPKVNLLQIQLRCSC